jgi:DNA-binding phage protein
LDIKIFRLKNGGVVQLADKEKMQEWPIELPLLFIEYIRNKQLDSYGSAKKEVEKYLDEILEDVAIPRLISVLKGVDNEEIILALTRIEEISRKNAEMAKPINKYLDELLKRNDKQIVKLAKTILGNFAKAERKKELTKKRKIMRDKEKLFLEGKINGEEYAKARKEYLTLKE